jgi:hypothetical protein
MKKTDNLNVSIMMAISQLFMKKYAEDDSLDDKTFSRHKNVLYAFFKDYCNVINDHKVHKLISKVK